MNATQQPVALAPSAVYVDTSDYERSHRKAPRGVGSWAFCTVRPGPDGYLSHLFFEYGSYGEAKRAARAKVASLGLDTVYVCS